MNSDTAKWETDLFPLSVMEMTEGSHVTFGPVSLFFRIASTDEKCHFAISWARSCQYQWLHKSLSKYSSVQEIGPFSLFQNLALGKASTDDKCHFAIPWASSCPNEYQFVCKILSKYSKRFLKELSFTIFFRIWTSAKPRPIPKTKISIQVTHS